MDSVFISAGENSGDKYGADLVRRAKEIHPWTFFGIGGAHMTSEGVNLLYDLRDLAVVGAVEILTRLPRIRRIFQGVKKEIIKKKPQAVVLIDAPDFHLRLAKAAKAAGIPVLYYISPTVWAWRKRRLKTIKKYVDRMLLIFPFEEKIYEENGISAVYIGHPLKERVKTVLSREAFFRKHGLDPDRRLLSILPGSRRSEIRYHMPVLVKAIRRIRRHSPLQFILVLAENLERRILHKYLSDEDVDLTILDEDRYEALAFSDVVLSACGTANLEAALLETPLLSFYRLSPLTYGFGARLVRIRLYSIVNILAGVRVIPELIQSQFTAKNLFQETQRILGSPKVRAKMVSHFREIRSTLGDKVASENAAQELLTLVRSRKSRSA